MPSADKVVDYIVLVNWGNAAEECQVMIVTASSEAGARKKALVYADQPRATATIMGTQ